jgi:hypothetical protein
MKGKDTALILIVALAAGVGAFLMSFEGTPALAQGKPTAGSMIAIPVAVNSAQQAVCLIDVNRQIMVTYELDSRFMIKLKSAREFAWDIQIRELNTDPKPSQVEDQVNRVEERRRKAEEKAAKLKGKAGS